MSLTFSISNLKFPACLKFLAVAGTLLALLAICSPLPAQQPQAQSGQPLYAVNAKYVNGVAPGYWPTAGAGLTLNLSAGSAYCGNPPALVTYAAGTLTMVNAATNLVYLDPAAICAPAVSQATNFAVGQIPIAKVVAAGGVITTITDMRGAGFAPLPCAMSSTGSVACSALGTNQPVTITPSGTGPTVLNGNVGIGTTAPNGALEVKSEDAANAGVVNMQYAVDGAAATMQWRNSAGTLLWRIGGGTQNQQNELSFDEGTVSRLYLKAGGNVGVGTISPQATLDTAGQDRRKPVAFSTLTACSSTIEGETGAVTDSTTNAWGATVTGSGTNHVLAYCDGTSWTVAAK